MKTHFIATAGRPDVYHRVGVVGDGEMSRFLNQTGVTSFRLNFSMQLLRWILANS
jgi:hypothetical protein